MKNRNLLALFLAATLPYLLTIGGVNAAECGGEAYYRSVTPSGSQDPFLLEFTVDGQDQAIWTSIDTNYICYNSATDYQTYNDDTATAFSVEFGNGTSGTNPWSANYTTVLYFEDDAHHDFSIYNQSVTKLGAVTDTTGPYGRALQFRGNGVADGYKLPGDVIDYTAGSVCALALVDGWLGASYYGALFGDPDSNSIIGFYSDQGAVKTYYLGGAAIDHADPTPNGYELFCVVWTSGDGYVYQNNSQIGTNGNNGGPTSTTDFWFGKWNSDAATDRSWNGRIAFGWIVNGTLSADSLADYVDMLINANYTTLGAIVNNNDPSINITMPMNSTYGQNNSFNLEWEFTVSAGSGASCDTALYSLNGGANVSIGCANTTVSLTTNGENNITIFANATDGYGAEDTEYFTIANPIINCSDSGAIEAVRFYFYDEDTLASENGSADYSLYLVDAGFSFTYNYSYDNVTNFSICIADSGHKVNMTMLFTASGYQQRTYYFYEANLTSTLQTINLYLKDTTDGEALDLNTKDSNDNDVEDVYVDIDRYYPDLDAWYTVAICKSDGTGKALTYIELDDVFHRFTLSQSGVVVNSYGAMTITDTTDDPETLTLYIAAQETQSFEMYKNIGYSCYFNATSNNTVCSVNDPTGLATSASLIVQRAALTGYTEICTDTGTGTSMTLTCSLGANPNGTYRYFLEVTPVDNPSYVFFTDIIEFARVTYFGDYGIFLTFLLVAVAGIAAAALGPVAGIVAVVMLAAATLMGLIDIGVSSIVGLLLVAALIFMKGRGV